MSLNPHELQDCVQQTVLFDLQSLESVKLTYSLTYIPSLTIMHTSVYLYNLWLFGTAGPERAQAEDEEDEEQYCHDCDYGDVAGVGQRGRVRSLSWNHVGQVQHVAERPACIAAFYLDTRINTVIH